MKLTRRELTAALLAPAAAAQNPQPAADPVQAARDRIRANGDALARVDLPMDTEPAFQFKA